MSKLPGVSDGFASDAWLANWDVIGNNRGNLLKDGDSGLRVDTGGALLYRARGEAKGNKFEANAVSELHTLRDAATNPDAAPIFSGLTNEQIKASIDKVVSVSDDTIKTLCKACGPGTAEQRDQLALDLISRKNILSDYARQLAEKIQSNSAD